MQCDCSSHTRCAMRIQDLMFSLHARGVDVIVAISLLKANRDSAICNGINRQ